MEKEKTRQTSRKKRHLQSKKAKERINNVQRKTFLFHLYQRLPTRQKYCCSFGNDYKNNNATQKIDWQKHSQLFDVC